MCRLSWNLGSSTSWNPQGLSRAAIGLIYLYLLGLLWIACIAYTTKHSTLDLPHSVILVAHSMVQSRSWAANWFAASQEIPRISRNPNVHYRTHKRPPPVSILGQPNPVHIPTSHLLQIHPNIIHPSKPRSPKWSLSFLFRHQDPIHPPLLTHTRHMPSPSSMIICSINWYILTDVSRQRIEPTFNDEAV